MERDEEHLIDLEIMFTCGKKELGRIIDRCIQKHGFNKTAEVLDAIKGMGYKYSTKGALTVAVADMLVPDQKPVFIHETEKKLRRSTKVQARLLPTMNVIVWSSASGRTPRRK